MIYNCLILARKNSKRIINKNLINFKGKPLIYWTLKQSLKLKRVKKIIVSSDSQKIRNVATKLSKKFLIDKRPKKLALSKTTSESVLKYLIKKYKILKNQYILLLQPTSPLRNQKDINQILNLARKYKLSSIHSVSNYLGKKVIKKDINILNKKKLLKHINLSFNGSIYLFKVKILIDKNSIYETPQNVYITKKKYSLDVDNYSDLKN
tara:strand:+ start:35 stop:658 length:624 start_codon:yes stop_codon:yes gene_type:complete